MIVHDLRTPLTSFIGGLESVKGMGELNEYQAECFEIALKGGYTLLDMIMTCSISVSWRMGRSVWSMVSCSLR